MKIACILHSNIQLFAQMNILSTQENIDGKFKKPIQMKCSFSSSLKLLSVKSAWIYRVGVTIHSYKENLRNFITKTVTFPLSLSFFLHLLNCSILLLLNHFFNPEQNQTANHFTSWVERVKIIVNLIIKNICFGFSIAVCCRNNLQRPLCIGFGAIRKNYIIQCSTNSRFGQQRWCV